jgi:hypothetical protein
VLSTVYTIFICGCLLQDFFAVGKQCNKRNDLTSGKKKICIADIYIEKKVLTRKAPTYTSAAFVNLHNRK